MSPYVAGALVLVCVALGWGVGVLLYRRVLSSRTRPDQSDVGLTDAVAFVGGAFGIILGLLLVFAVQHFADTRDIARQEAASAVAMFNAASPYPPEDRSDVRRSVICYMRAVAQDDWEASRRADLTGSENVAAWAAKIQHRVDALPFETKSQESTHYFMVDNSLQLDSDRSVRLQLALPEIPPAIWVVIFVCTFGFITLLTIHLGPRRRLRIITVLVSTVVLLAVVMSLAALDEPYTGTTATIAPVAMESSLVALEDAFPKEDWGPCPTLVANEPQ
ncbi:MAG: hypothetical protein U0R64_07035 [Candidatus Nanopelagicales bacterium]